MDINTIATFISFPVGIVCMIIAIRAFYAYAYSRSEMLLVLGLAMTSIALGIYVGIVGIAHLGGNHYNLEWAKSTGSISGAFFIFMSSMVKSHAQLKSLRHFQYFCFALFVIVIAITPLIPPFSTPMIPAGLNAIRTVAYGAAFVRYASLYINKGTRFSMIISAGFLLLVAGFIMNTPQMFSHAFAVITIEGGLIRIIGYSTLLIAYSIG